VIKPEETEIAGNWIAAAGGVTADPACQRIETLVRDYLQMVADRGWEKLFKDPPDSRRWELTYPRGAMQGGGPPKLATLAESKARQKYYF